MDAATNLSATLGDTPILLLGPPLRARHRKRAREPCWWVLSLIILLDTTNASPHGFDVGVSETRHPVRTPMPSWVLSPAETRGRQEATPVRTRVLSRSWVPLADFLNHSHAASDDLVQDLAGYTMDLPHESCVAPIRQRTNRQPIVRRHPCMTTHSDGRLVKIGESVTGGQQLPTNWAPPSIRLVAFVIVRSPS